MQDNDDVGGGGGGGGGRPRKTRMKNEDGRTRMK